MKILYAIQGTGNGHLSRARDVIPVLQRKGDLDLLVSGIQCDLTLPYPVKYHFRGLSFIFGKKGGVDLWDTYKKSNLKRLFEEINTLPVEQYDIVINDFEPVSAWACYLRSKDCIALSHQAAVLHKKAPKPKSIDVVGKSILKNYAPATHHYGFHFKSYDNNIFTPVIRREIRELPPENLGHFTVYLPAYEDDRIVKVLTACKNVPWQVFSKHSREAYRIRNVSIQPINNETFIESMRSAAGVLCGAGFETPAEAIFLRKKLLVIPMKQQFEQQCNAAALQELGVPVLKSLKPKHADFISDWTVAGKTSVLNYPDETEAIIDHILKTHSGGSTYLTPGKKAYSVKEFRKLSMRKILVQLAG